MKERIIGGRRCCFFGEEGAETLLIQPVDARELESLDREEAAIRALALGKASTLAAFLIEDWNNELSPWPAPPVFGEEGFGGGAAETLAWIEEQLLPAGPAGGRCFLGGYSLAGLFALWAGCRTTKLDGVAAVSPSVWFPGWDEYMHESSCLAPRVYLSLGDREERTRNKTMARVGDNIRTQYEILSRSTDCVLEWNPGNHFAEPELRMSRGFAWLLKRGERE